jgi:hypothetical protein
VVTIFSGGNTGGAGTTPDVGSGSPAAKRNTVRTCAHSGSQHEQLVRS